MKRGSSRLKALIFLIISSKAARWNYQPWTDSRSRRRRTTKTSHPRPLIVLLGQKVNGSVLKLSPDRSIRVEDWINQSINQRWRWRRRGERAGSSWAPNGRDTARFTAIITRNKLVKLDLITGRFHVVIHSNRRNPIGSTSNENREVIFVLAEINQFTVELGNSAC